MTNTKTQKKLKTSAKAKKQTNTTGKQNTKQTETNLHLKVN